MNEIIEIKKMKEAIINTVNGAFDRLLLTFGNEESTDFIKEYVYPLNINTNIFIGKKPTAVLFGEERVDVKTWREVYEVILKRCNQDEEYHKTLMYLRNKVSGKSRTFLSDKPDGMIRPLKIDNDLYGEIQYGSATLMHILLTHILAHVGFDYYGISLVLKEGKRKYG